jgi:hypothetical protein
MVLEMKQIALRFSFDSYVLKLEVGKFYESP